MDPKSIHKVFTVGEHLTHGLVLYERLRRGKSYVYAYLSDADADADTEADADADARNQPLSN